eukprot:CAMPEP_0198301214 /NCGR_PEP_ID=MMETSP1449-20131203/50774_1 /TAXON_ID=420275 /ORGANISM="Attheya septentrionalis, Strain CCMP2084" /LENGTH=277 /DNA_ID=CAMNT_0044003231 /DNA_START=85 /DNA_END=919 /DNA_ORIENTATION=+
MSTMFDDENDDALLGLDVIPDVDDTGRFETRQEKTSQSLIIDEVAMAPRFKKATVHPHKNVIGSTEFGAAVYCPCCNISLSKCKRGTQENQLTATAISPTNSGKHDGEDRTAPGLLSADAQYDISQDIVSGWVYKKGTGKDWIGSRAWKPRWARLVLAKIAGYEVDVPLLLIYWFSSTPKPSTVIILNSTVVLPVDRYKNTNENSEPPEIKWNTFCFDVIHAREGSVENVTRTFSAPQEERDQWVSAISRALFDFEKRRKNAQLTELAVRFILKDVL